MNQQLNDASYRWLNVPRWYLWEGGFLLIGQAKGVVPAHSHHAIQIVISLDEPFAICGHQEDWRQGRGLIVRPDAVHSFDCNGAFGAMLFVDPESSEGVWLQTLFTENITFVPVSFSNPYAATSSLTSAYPNVPPPPRPAPLTPLIELMMMPDGSMRFFATSGASAASEAAG